MKRPLLRAGLNHGGAAFGTIFEGKMPQPGFGALEQCHVILDYQIGEAVDRERIGDRSGGSKRSLAAAERPKPLYPYDSRQKAK